MSAANPVAPRPGRFTARPSVVRTVAFAELLPDVLGARRVVLDARAPDRFRGENETLDPVGGHIPGARNRPFLDNVGPDGRFKPAERLRDEFAAVLADASTEGVVSQCGSGVTACHNLLALEVAGLPGAALYPGSWSEWCAQPRAPASRGGD